jgi:diphthamide biosynthesis protein 4
MNPAPGEGFIFTVDQITLAFSTLSDPKSRAAYDASLAVDHYSAIKGTDGNRDGKDWKTGIETVDLDDLEVCEEENVEQVWYRGCRCGDEKGFVVRERDLEDAAQDGEVTVGCKGCSLWLKVLFGVVEDGEEG